MGTSVVHRVTILDASDYAAAIATLKASLPAKGSNFTATQLKAVGGFCIGRRDRDPADDADIDSENVTVTPIHEGVHIRAAGSQTREKYIPRHNGIDEVTFSAYDIEEGVFELDSTVVDDDGDVQRTATQTDRAILIERDGYVLEGYPKVVLLITGEPGGFGPGDDAASKYDFTGYICKATGVPSGQQKFFYQEAGT